MEPAGGHLLLDADVLYWVRAPELFILPIGETTASSLVSDANLPVDWTVRGDRVYYLSEPAPLTPPQLRTVPRTGGASELLAQLERPAQLVAVDDSGVYWFDYEEPGQGPRYCGYESAAGIQKYTFTSGAVPRFAAPEESVDMLLTAA